MTTTTNLWIRLLRAWLRLGGSPLSMIGHRILVQAIKTTPPGGGFEIVCDGRWWSPIRLRREACAAADVN